MSLQENQIALIGLAVMGQNFALNMARHKIHIGVYNRSYETTEKFCMAYDKNHHSDENEKYLSGYMTLPALIASLERPRKIIILVKAGEAVDSVLQQLYPLLSPDDIVIDSGNSHFEDTERRLNESYHHHVHYIGMGISGGEMGALQGPSLMPGGDRGAYEAIAPILKLVAAQEPSPCIEYMGARSAGHYVKMVHNGIEYADMQLIAEIYDLLKNLFRLNSQERQKSFEYYQTTELNSYLIEITEKILKFKDDKNVKNEENHKDLLDQIVDVAHGKGTGKWTIQEATELGIPTSMIHAALEGRFLSTHTDLRKKMSSLYLSPASSQIPPEIIVPIPTSAQEINFLTANALLCGKILAYAQGLHLLSTASTTYSYHLDLSKITSVWRGGCIIRSTLLGKMAESMKGEGREQHLLLSPFFKEIIEKNISSLRKLVVLATENGIGVPAHSAALCYFDNLRRTHLPTNLIQAQRDFFGAHTYERKDMAGNYHTEWEKK